MRVTDIEEGKLYRSEFGRPVRVIETGVRVPSDSLMSSVNAVVVEYLSDDGTVARTAKVKVRDLKGPWTHEDEVRRQTKAAQNEQEDRFAAALHNAGFNTAAVSHRYRPASGFHDSLVLNLEGQDALDAISILLERRSQTVDGVESIKEIEEKNGNASEQG